MPAVTSLYAATDEVEWQVGPHGCGEWSWEQSSEPTKNFAGGIGKAHRSGQRVDPSARQPAGHPLAISHGKPGVASPRRGPGW